MIPTLGSYVSLYTAIITSGLLVAGLGTILPLIKSYTNRFSSLILGILTVYGILIVAVAVISYQNFSQYIDLSYYDNAIRQLSRWQLPLIWDTGAPVWAQHFSPIWFLFVPLYWLGAGAGTLIFLQATFAVLAGIPLYLWSFHRSRSRLLATALVAAYLLFGGMQSSVFYGFHEVTFFPFFFFWVLYFWEIRSFRLFVLFSLLTLFIKEEIGFVFIFLGVFLAVLKQKRYALTALGFGILWSAISFGIIAYFRHGGYEYWGQFGAGSSGGLVGILEFALPNPLKFLGQFVNDARKPLMFIEVFGSFGFLPLVWPPALLILVPSLLIKLLSNDIAMLDSYHYSAVLSGLLPAISLLAIVRIAPTRIYRFLGWYLLVVAVFSSCFYGKDFYYSGYALMSLGNIKLSNFTLSQDADRINSALAMIPANSSVSCQYQLCAHLVRTYGNKYPAPGGVLLDYVIYDTSLPLILTDPLHFNEYVLDKVVPNYNLIYQNGTTFIFRKRNL